MSDAFTQAMLWCAIYSLLSDKFDRDGRPGWAKMAYVLSWIFVGLAALDAVLGYISWVSR